MFNIHFADLRLTCREARRLTHHDMLEVVKDMKRDRGGG